MILIFKYIFLFGLRIIDIPDLFIKEDRSAFLLKLRDLGIYNYDRYLLNFVAALSDILVSLNIASFDYFLTNSLFPNNLASIENLILHFQIQELYPLLCYYEPLYYLLLPGKINNLLAILSLTNESSFTEFLLKIYKNGYRFSHMPSLSAFWYLSMCMVEQYSSLSYTLILIYGKYLANFDIRLIPMFRNGSGFTSYLPHVINSAYLGVYAFNALIFTYLYSNFNKVEIVNTNFLHWATLFFLGFYIWDLIYGSLKKKSLK